MAITMAVGMVAVGSIIAQRALADKVGPHPNENLVKQGGLGDTHIKNSLFSLYLWLFVLVNSKG